MSGQSPTDHLNLAADPAFPTLLISLTVKDHSSELFGVGACRHASQYGPDRPQTVEGQPAHIDGTEGGERDDFAGGAVG